MILNAPDSVSNGICRLRRGQPTREPSIPQPAIPSPSHLGGGEGVHVMDKDWSDFYASCPEVQQIWEDIHAPAEDQKWPRGVKFKHHRVYFGELVWVPQGLTEEVTQAYHQEWGHIGAHRLAQELRTRFLFPDSHSIEDMAQKVKRACPTCQLAEPPNWQVARKQNMTLVPDRLFASVCLDIFSMQPAIWQGEMFDAFLLCVDRLSG